MITLYTVLVIAAIMMQAFFTASEMAFTSVNRIKLKGLVDAGDKRAMRLSGFLDKGTFLGTTLVGTNITVVVASTLATRILMGYFDRGIAPVVATAIMVPVTLIFAEIVPKIIARQFSTGLSLRAMVPLNSFFRLFYPLIVSVNAVAKFFISPFSRSKDQQDMTLSKSDLKKILLWGHETGEVEADEVELIHRILDFGSKKIESIMVPLFRVSSISSDDSTENLRRLVSFTGYSRIPVYEKKKNKIVGIVNIYDILFSMEEREETSEVKDFVREPVCVNREDGLDIALARLRHRKQPMGIVVGKDEEVVGIVTIEDMLEEIVGEIEDTGQ